jgi:DNA-binding transcriptional LysR family regulator
VRLTELAKHDGLLELVERGELDLTFAALPLPEGPFASQILLRDPFVLVVARDARLKAGRAVPAEELAKLPLIGFGHGMSMEQAELHLRSRGIPLNIVFRANYNGTVQGLVAAGVGAAIAPLLTVDTRRPDTRVVGEIAGVPPRLIALAWHKDRYRSPAVEAFIETARRVSATLSPGSRKAGRRRGDRERNYEAA